MALDQKWHPKSTWKHSHFPQKFVFSFKRIFVLVSHFYIFRSFTSPDEWFYSQKWGRNPECSSAQTAGYPFAVTLPGKPSSLLEVLHGQWAERSLGSYTKGKASQDQPWSPGHSELSHRSTSSTKGSEASMRWICRPLRHTPLKSGFGKSWQSANVRAADFALWTFCSHSSCVTDQPSLSTWHKPEIERKPGMWEDHVAGVLAWACPRCWTQGKFCTFSTPDPDHSAANGHNSFYPRWLKLQWDHIWKSFKCLVHVRCLQAVLGGEHIDLNRETESLSGKLCLAPGGTDLPKRSRMLDSVS